MEEKVTTKPNENSQNKKERNSFADYKAEFKKIIWPDRKEVGQKTVTVIVTALIVGAMIFCMDTVFSFGYNAIIGLIG